MIGCVALLIGHLRTTLKTMNLPWNNIILAIGWGVPFGVIIGSLFVRLHNRQIISDAKSESAMLLANTRSNLDVWLYDAECNHQNDMLDLRQKTIDEIEDLDKSLIKRETELEVANYRQESVAKELNEHRDEVNKEYHKLRSLQRRKKHYKHEINKTIKDMQEQLSIQANISLESCYEQLMCDEIDRATAIAKQKISNTDDAVFEDDAAKIMHSVVGRYSGHFLTENATSHIPLTAEMVELFQADDGLLLKSIGEVANINMLLMPETTSIRLEGLDGVGREVARRSIKKIEKSRRRKTVPSAPVATWVGAIRKQLDIEIISLGKKAFSVLEIPKPHEDIVVLVGQLNYRTSYTQNQWLHAVEAAFLGGMMASEMGLDVKLARRATLMHDIGKALTHEIEGSHAVIGADIARKLGELEIVSNAIGAHHGDEPANSVYAHLVAASDAMSGARPGARREMSIDYGKRIEDLEKITRKRKHINNCYVIQGGRELIVEVKSKFYTDKDMIDLSSDIAENIEQDLVYPGQIKVTAIRRYEEVTTAN